MTRMSEIDEGCHAAEFLICDMAKAASEVIPT